MCEVLSGATATTTTIATMVNLIKPISMPMPSTTEQLTSDQNLTGIYGHCYYHILLVK